MRTNRYMKRISCLALLALAGLLAGCKEKGPDKYELRDAAVAIYEQGDYEGAITAFNQALAASGGEVTELQYDILKYRAECEIRTGDYTAAKETYTALLELEPEGADHDSSEELLRQLGALDKIKEAADLFRSGKYADAYDAFEEYAVLDGTLTGRAAVYDRAVCAEYMGRYEEAYNILTEYLVKYPDDEAARKEANFCRSRL